MLSRFFSRFLTQDIAMDLGTANTLLYTRKHGIFINEPSVVAVDAVSRKVLAVGAAAKEYLGRTPQNICAIRPMKDGVIADFDITREMIAHFVGKCISGLRLVKPSMVICIPTGITQVEKKAVIDAALLSGARSVSLVEEPMAAAIGAGMPVQEPLGNLVLDIGGGTSEVAVISLGGIVASRSVRVGGDEFDQSIIAYIKRKYNLLIGERTAEDIKIQIGSAYPLEEETTLEIKGRNLVDGLPKNITIGSEEIREALSESLYKVVDAVKETLERTPPELSADIIDHGITLSGGGALLRGLDQLISNETGIDVHVAETPLDCVALGSGAVLDHIDKLGDVLDSNSSHF